MSVKLMSPGDFVDLSTEQQAVVEIAKLQVLEVLCNLDNFETESPRLFENSLFIGTDGKKYVNDKLIEYLTKSRNNDELGYQFYNEAINQLHKEKALELHNQHHNVGGWRSFYALREY